eukprot:PhM_4_TR16791/c0_g2_i1/m.50574
MCVATRRYTQYKRQQQQRQPLPPRNTGRSSSNRNSPTNTTLPHASTTRATPGGSRNEPIVLTPTSQNPCDVMNAQTLESVLEESRLRRERLEAVGVDVPNSLMCPITGELFVDPVVTADGHTYERAAILHWFGQGKRTSPVTNATLDSLSVVPNHTVRSHVADLLDSAASRAPSSAASPQVVVVVEDPLVNPELVAERPRALSMSSSSSSSSFRSSESESESSGVRSFTQAKKDRAAESADVNNNNNTAVDDANITHSRIQMETVERGEP